MPCLIKLLFRVLEELKVTKYLSTAVGHPDMLGDDVSSSLEQGNINSNILFLSFIGQGPTC